MRIWTDDEYIEVEPNDVGQLEAAMLFKAEHIKAKADPELFAAVADMLSRLWDSATKRVDVVRCRDCVYWGNEETKVATEYQLFCVCDAMKRQRKAGNCMTNEDFFCAHGERRADE